MIITLQWLKEHLKTKASENEVINKLTNIGLEVENVKENSVMVGIPAKNVGYDAQSDEAFKPYGITKESDKN